MFWTIQTRLVLPCGQSCRSHFAATLHKCNTFLLPQQRFYPSAPSLIVHTFSKHCFKTLNFQGAKLNQEYLPINRFLRTINIILIFVFILMFCNVKVQCRLFLQTFWQFPPRHFANVTPTSTSRLRHVLTLMSSHVLGQSRVYNPHSIPRGAASVVEVQW